MSDSPIFEKEEGGEENRKRGEREPLISFYFEEEQGEGEEGKKREVAFHETSTKSILRTALLLHNFMVTR